jgi:hypothetical protein
LVGFVAGGHLGVVKKILKSSESRGGQRGKLHGKGATHGKCEIIFYICWQRRLIFPKREAEQWKQQPK